MTIKLLAAIATCALLTACGQGDQAESDKPETDPAVAQALNDPIMVDPDLSSRNEGAAAITIDSENALPVLPPTPEAMAAARTEAAGMLGGAAIAVPDAEGAAAGLPPGGSAADHLAMLPGGARCAARLSSSAIWAARLPPELPVYPRGATVSAAGSDAGSCHVRVVRYATPIPAEEVLAFYWTRATQARYRPHYRKTGNGTAVLSGRNGTAAFDLRIEAGPKEGAPTRVDIATIFGS